MKIKKSTIKLIGYGFILSFFAVAMVAIAVFTQTDIYKSVDSDGNDTCSESQNLYSEVNENVKKITDNTLDEVTLKNILQSKGLIVDRSGVLYKDGRPYRAIGVNYFSALYRTILNPADTSYIRGFQELSTYNIPFVRIMMGGFWPNDLKLYKNNREKYFRIIDNFLEVAEKNNIGIIASLHWNSYATPDLVNEPLAFIGKSNSNTQKFMRTYTRDMAERYGHRKIIWAWEFGNELSLYADFPNAKLLVSDTRINEANGTPSVRNPLDKLTVEDAGFAYEDFAKTFKSIYPKVLLSTGNALPRAYSYHNSFFEGTLCQWNYDSERQFCKVLQRDNPDGYDLVSIHIYPNEKIKYFGDKANDYQRVINVASQCAKDSGKALFIGEFGVNSTKYNGNKDLEVADFNKLLSAIENSSVALAALWVYDFSWQADSFNVTGTSNRSYQLEAIKLLNSKFKDPIPVE